MYRERIHLNRHYPSSCGRRPHAISSSRKDQKIKVNKFRISKKYEATAQVRDKNSTTGVMCSSSKEERNSDALLFSKREDRPEYRAKEARVKAWKLRKEISSRPSASVGHQEHNALEQQHCVFGADVGKLLKITPGSHRRKRKSFEVQGGWLALILWAPSKTRNGPFGAHFFGLEWAPWAISGPNSKKEPPKCPFFVCL